MRQGTAKREAVRIEGASTTTTSRFGRASSSIVVGFATVGVAVVLTALSLTGGHTSSATASVQPDPSPTPTSPAPSIEAPTITAPTPDSVVTSASTTVAGVKTPGSGVQVQNGAGDVLCIVDASAGAAYSCPVTLGAGAAVTIRAVATAADGSDAGRRTSITVGSVPPPSIGGGSASGNGLITGVGIPGASVSVSSSAGSCSSTADSSGAWACLLPAGAADGSHTATATQIAAFLPSVRSDASPAVALVLDRTVPSPPVLTAPRGGSSPGSNVRFEGSGEDGATVTVFSGSASVCQAIVSRGAWSCVAARLEDGNARIVAIQRDTAGNTSGGSAALDLRIGGSPETPVPAPSPDPEDTPSGTTPSAVPQPEEEDEEPGTPAAPTDPDEATTAPLAPWGGDTWDAATPFTAPHAPLFSTGNGADWVRTLLLALGTVAVVFLARKTLPSPTVVAGARRDASAGSGLVPLRITGRNRRDVEPRRVVVASPATAVTMVAALVAVAGLLILSRPIDGTPAYARLLFASLTATFVVALVSVAVPAAVARWSRVGRVHTTVDPRGFLLIAGSVALSRLLGLEPPLLFALVLTASTSLAVNRAIEGRVAAARILSLAALGGVAWAVGSLLPALGVGGFAGPLASETLNVVTAASLGSAAVLLLPVGASAGRSLWAASRAVWVAVGLVVVTLELVLLGSRTPEATAGVTVVGSILVIACLALVASVSIWRRHVDPLLDEPD